MDTYINSSICSDGSESIKSAAVVNSFNGSVPC